MLFSFFTKNKVANVAVSRETVEVISYAKGVVRQVGNSDEYMIECSARHLKLNPVNLPSEYREADLPIIFSGDIKATQPLEDEFGEYFEVKSIQ